MIGAVAIGPCHLYITVALGVIRHAERGVIIELLVLEVITQPRLQRQITVGVETIAQTDVQFIGKATSLTITKIERVEQGRDAQICWPGISMGAVDEVVANVVPKEITKATLMLQGVGSILSDSDRVFTVVVVVDFLFGGRQ